MQRIIPGGLAAPSFGVMIAVLSLLTTLLVVAPAEAAGIGQPINLLPPITYNEPDQPDLIPIPGEEQLKRNLRRTPVFYRTSHPVGTVIVDTSERYLYLITGQGRALRYGVAPGREGFQWEGAMKVTKKVEWPSWTPPKDMIAREKKKGHILPATMKGGPGNPLGARALYLGYSQYRIHGTNAPKSIGQAASSGCIRMLNEHIIDLYTKVPVGTRVVVVR